jgi:hypothetical protein
MTYILQLDDYTCGPVAIINANVWKNGSCYLGIENLSQKCKTNKIRGTERWDLDVTILGISQKPAYNISLIKEELAKGNSAIILISFRNSDNSVGAHYIFVEKADNNKLLAHNSSYRDDISKYKDEYFEDWDMFYDSQLKFNPNDEKGLFYPCAWIVKKDKRKII